MSFKVPFAAGVLALAVGGSALAAPFTLYNDRALFEATLQASVTDDYSNAGYNANNNINALDVLSNAAMSAVLGETTYVTTGHNNLNGVLHQNTNAKYCSGCNGSFRLGFGATSVSVDGGVFGVGFEFFNSDSPLYHAFVTFADSSTADFALVFAGFTTGALTSFFGTTSTTGIASIHFGLANGGTVIGGTFGLDNLTIGSAVPQPPTAWLALLGLAALACARHRPLRASSDAGKWRASLWSQ